MAVDYASELGIRSFIAPIVFAGLYFLLLACFFIQAVRVRVVCSLRIYFIIALFCAVRIAAFVLRALVARVPSDAENLHLFVAYEALYDAGFFAVLWSADELITARVALRLPKNSVKGPISSLLRLPFLFFTLFAVAALSVAGAIMSGLGVSQSIVNTGNTLGQVATYVFLGCAAVVFLRTWFLPPVVLSQSTEQGWAAMGHEGGAYVLFVMSVLLLVREVFSAVTVHDLSKRRHEAFWYPFCAVTEFLAVVLCAAPGLVSAGTKHN